MDTKNKHIDKIVENISLQTCILEVGNIPLMGELLNALTDLEENASVFDSLVFSNVTKGLQNYLDKIVLNEETDIKPIEEGVQALQAIWRDISKGEEFIFDISDVLENLGFDQNSQTEISKDNSYKNGNGKNISQKRKSPCAHSR